MTANTSATYIKFPVSAAIIAAYNTDVNADLFDLADGTFVLWLHPSGYQPIIEDLGERRIIRGWNTATIVDPPYSYGFEVTTSESREAVAKVLTALRQEANGGAVVVRDYVAVDIGDEAQGYTSRQVLLTIPQAQSGSLMVGGPTGSRYFSGGFSFRCLQV